MRVPATKVDKNFQFTPFQRIRISFRNHFSPFEASKFLSISHFHKNFQPSPNVIAIYPDRQIHLKNIAYGEFYQFNLSSCIRQQNSLTA